jgi:hypothetical protein
MLLDRDMRKAPVGHLGMTGVHVSQDEPANPAGRLLTLSSPGYRTKSCFHEFSGFWNLYRVGVHWFKHLKVELRYILVVANRRLHKLARFLRLLIEGTATVLHI